MNTRKKLPLLAKMKEISTPASVKALWQNFLQRLTENIFYNAKFGIYIKPNNACRNSF